MSHGVQKAPVGFFIFSFFNKRLVFLGSNEKVCKLEIDHHWQLFNQWYLPSVRVNLEVRNFDWSENFWKLFTVKKSRITDMTLEVDFGWLLFECESCSHAAWMEPMLLNKMKYRGWLPFYAFLLVFLVSHIANFLICCHVSTRHQFPCQNIKCLDIWLQSDNLSD